MLQAVLAWEQALCESNEIISEMARLSAMQLVAISSIVPAKKGKAAFTAGQLLQVL